MMRPCTVLIADDDKFIRGDLADLLKDDGHKLIFAGTAKETWEQTCEHKPNLILLDIKFPDSSDLSTLQRIKQAFPQTAVIILTSQTDNVAQIVSAMKMGAFDYVGKPFIGHELRNRIENSLSLQKLVRSQERLLNELEERAGLEQLVGTSEAIKKVVETVRNLATSEGLVVIRGETGTGKELVARALHYLSQRRTNPFVVVNCAAIPEALIESVFFGHRRGAFTGAIETFKGKFEAAEDGTLFLDEIGDMPLEQQASLLRVLEYRTFTPIGETKERECRARFILATNRDLREATKNGTFRDDLYYRINVNSIHLPTLRSRIEDIPPLVEYYVGRLSNEISRPAIRIHREVLELFQKYDWPGNVRELKHVLEGALMLARPGQDEITLQDLPSELLASREPEQRESLTIRQVSEKKDLIRALEQCRGNQTDAAKILGYHRNTIRAKLRFYGIS